MTRSPTPPAPQGIPAPESFEEPVVLYSTRWCGYCWSASRLLQRRGVPYAQVDVTGNADARAWLREITGRRTVPQIFIRGRSIGGFTELASLDRDGELR